MLLQGFEDQMVLLPLSAQDISTLGLCAHLHHLPLLMLNKKQVLSWDSPATCLFPLQKTHFTLKHLSSLDFLCAQLFQSKLDLLV